MGMSQLQKRYHKTSRAVVFETESYTPHQSYIFPNDGKQDFRILGRYVFATSLLK
jgi:repressor LexA